MVAKTSDIHPLGSCPVCQTPLVRNKQGAGKAKALYLEALNPPEGAAFNQLRLNINTVWCPVCGWINRVELPDEGFVWENRK